MEQTPSERAQHLRLEVLGMLASSDSRDQLTQTLTDWVQQHDRADAAFALALVHRELEPLADPIVEVCDPQDWTDAPPIYEGPAADAYRHLVPGNYLARAADGPVQLRVMQEISAALSPNTEPVAVAEAGWIVLGQVRVLDDASALVNPPVTPKDVAAAAARADASGTVTALEETRAAERLRGLSSVADPSRRASGGATTEPGPGAGRGRNGQRDLGRGMRR